MLLIYIYIYIYGFAQISLILKYNFVMHQAFAYDKFKNFSYDIKHFRVINIPILAIVNATSY